MAVGRSRGCCLSTVGRPWGPESTCTLWGAGVSRREWGLGWGPCGDFSGVCSGASENGCSCGHG